MAYQGGKGTTTGGKDTKIPFPNAYTDMADVPAILEERSLAIFNLVEASKTPAMTDASFETFLQKFLVAKKAEIRFGTADITLTTSEQDMGLEVSAPFAGLALISYYLNTDGTFSGTGDLRTAIRCGAGAVISNPVVVYHQHTVTSVLSGHEVTGATTWNVAQGDKITMTALRGSTPSAASAKTRWLYVTFLKIPHGTPASPTAKV